MNGRGAGDGRATRYDVPRLARPALLRERLIEQLTRRWSVPITVVAAGAGFGKTTLLAQAVAENALDPRGEDRWLSCRSDDSVAASLAAAIADTLGEPSLHGGAIAVGAARIAEAMRARAPAHICLVLDDTHVLQAGSPAATFLAELLDELPSNGHVVFVGRTEPPVPLARRRAVGLVNDIAEAALAFTDDEARAFAALRVATPGSIAGASGWPALAELLVSTDRAIAVEYLWDEVLRDLDEPRRRALAMLSALGGGDDELLSAAVDYSVDVREVTRSVPLATVTDRGWATIHELWGPALTRVLSGDERVGGCLRAASVARARGDFTQAVRLYGAGRSLEDVRELVMRVCSDSHPLVPTEVLTDWHRLLVAGGFGDTAEAALLTGAIRKPADPLASIPFFELGASRFAKDGNIDGEIACVFHLGHIAWWHEDFDRMAGLLTRGIELADQGSRLAASIVTLGPLVLGEVMGDSDGVIKAARSSPREHQHPEVVPLTDFLEARAHLMAGDPQSALEPATRACAAATPTMRPPAEFERLSCLWALGRRDEVLERVHVAMAELEEVAWLHNRAANGAQAALWLCLGGRADAARSMLGRAQVVREASGGWARALVGLAEAMVAVDDGDEQAAAAMLAAELACRPLDDPSVARAHRSWIALTYVLVPATRTFWDCQALRGSVAMGRECGRAIVAVREDCAPEVSALPRGATEMIRAQLPVPWLADLAVAVAVDGRVSESEALLEGLSHRGLSGALRCLAKSRAKPIATAAATMLAARSALPERTLHIGTLGPLVVSLDGVEHHPQQLNRKAVRELLMLLIEHGSVTRSQAAAQLWPDLDDDAARNNLRVTLSHLMRALQPDRPANEPSSYLEDHIEHLRLRASDAIVIDAAQFIDAMGRAADHERHGAVSLAQHDYRCAADLYRGDYLAAAGDAEWAHAPRERMRLLFVRAAVRAGELALAGGSIDEATELALRAITVDAWSEPARRLLAEARLAGGDRSGALRALDECERVLAELGVAPEPATQMLARRVGSRP